MKFERAITEKIGDGDDFYSIIENAKGLLKNNDWWSVVDKNFEEEALDK